MSDNEVTVHAVNPDFEAVHPEAKYVNYVYSGADSTREHRVKATNTPTAGVNPGRVSFTAKLNPNEILDRCVMVEFEITAKVTASVGVARSQNAFAKTNGLCLAAYPIQRCCNNLNVKLNTHGESVTPWEYIGAYNHTYDSLELRRMLTFPGQPDNYNNIAALTYSGGPRVVASTREFSNRETTSATEAYDPGAIGPPFVPGTRASRSIDLQAAPDSPYAGYCPGYDQPRSMFPPSSIEFTEAPGATAQEVVITWTVTEPLIHPFFRHTDSKSVLSRISNMDIEMSFNSANAAYTIAQELIKNYVDTATDDKIANSNVENLGFTANAYLVYRTHVPNVEIRPVLTARYNRLAVYTEQVPAPFTAIGQSQTMNTSQKIFSHVPEKIFIFARPRGQFTDTTSPEAFLRIDNLTFRTLENAGCLSQATNAQLFQMSARNGLTMSYNKFNRDIGSIIVIDVRKGDIGAYVPGTPGNFQFDLSLTVTNTQFNRPMGVNSQYMIAGPRIDRTGDLPYDNAAVVPIPQNANWDLYVIGTIPSKLVLDGTSGYSSTGEDTQEILRAIGEKPVHLVDGSAGALGGKSGWQKFLSGIGQVFGLVKDGVNTVNQVRGALGRGMGDDLGAGMGSDYGSGVISGGAVRTGGRVLRTLK